MTDPNIGDKLRELHADRGSQKLPRDSYQRLLQRIERGKLRIRHLIGYGIAVGAAVVVVAGILRYSSDRPQDLGGFLASNSGSFEWRGGGDTLQITRGIAELVDPAKDARLIVRSGSDIGREKGGIRVARGRVTFDVTPRSQQEYRVLVSHGTIEVVGTVFTVAQHNNAGEVEVASGWIRFTRDTGESLKVVAGDELKWPAVPPEVVDTPEADAGAAPPRRRKAKSKKWAPALRDRPALRASTEPIDLDGLLAELETLRLRREYGALVRRIQTALPSIDDAALSERLSFERCDTLIRHLDDAGRACRAIAVHQRAYPVGRHYAYLDEIAKEYNCGPEP